MSSNEQVCHKAHESHPIVPVVEKTPSQANRAIQYGFITNSNVLELIEVPTQNVFRTHWGTNISLWSNQSRCPRQPKLQAIKSFKCRSKTTNPSLNHIWLAPNGDPYIKRAHKHWSTGTQLTSHNQSVPWPMVEITRCGEIDTTQATHRWLKSTIKPSRSPRALWI